MDNTTCDPTNRTNSASNLLPKQDIEHPEQTFPPASLAAAQMEMSTDKVTDPDTVPIKKSAPRRVMVLIGMPAPVLPPRPVFPPELERYQIQDSGRDSCSQYSVQMQAYLTSLRQDYERQLKDYDLLKHFAQEDKSFANAVMDELDALDEDPFTLDSFENLMRMHASKGKDFILARVTTQDPNDDTKLYHSYYGAHQINKVLFRTQPDEGLLHRMKARNPLNNMLIVGDVHYYMISAEDVNAIKPLPAVRSSSSSISSHSSRMSRCSKLAAQAIASQSASARSSPILGSDASLFSRISEVELPVSIIPPMMAMSILKADQEDRSASGSNTGGFSAEAPNFNAAPRPRMRRRSVGSSSFYGSSSSTVTRSSRLCQSIDPFDGPAFSSSSSLAGIQDRSRQGELEFGSEANHCPMSSSMHRHGSCSQQQQQNLKQGQGPHFQSLMGGQMRGPSSTISSSQSNHRAKSDHSHSSKYSAAASDVSDVSVLSPRTPSASSPSPSSPVDKTERATFKFRYLASDDDFLLRSAVRQIFKANALETWDAILFTISNNALREYSNQGAQGQQTPLPPNSSLASGQNRNQSQNHNHAQTAQTPAQEASQSRDTTEAVPSESATVLQASAASPPQSNGTVDGADQGSSTDLSCSMSSFSTRDPSTSITTTGSAPSSSSLPLSSSSSYSSSAAATGGTIAADSAVSRLDSGHGSSVSLPGDESGTEPWVVGNRGSRASDTRGKACRPQSEVLFPSASEGDLLDHRQQQNTQQQEKVFGKRKIRRALSKIFSLS